MAARRGLIRLYWFQGRSEPCLLQGQEAATLGQPEALETLMTRAEAYLFGGLPEKALPLFERVIDIDPWNSGAYWLRVTAAAWSFRYDLVVEAARDFEQRFGTNPQVSMFLGGALHARGDVAAAERAFESALADFEDDPNLSVIRTASSFYRSTGRTDRASEILAAGIRYLSRLNQENPKVRMSLAVSHAFLGDETAFRVEEEWLMERVGTWALTLEFLARGYIILGDVKTGIDLMQRATLLGHLDDFRFRFTLIMADVPLDDPRVQPLLGQLEAARARIAELY